MDFGKNFNTQTKVKIKFCYKTSSNKIINSLSKKEVYKYVANQNA